MENNLNQINQWIPVMYNPFYQMMVMNPPYMNYGYYQSMPNMIQPSINNINTYFQNHNLNNNHNMNIDIINQNNNNMHKQAQKLNKNIFNQAHRFKKINEINKPLSVDENNSNQQQSVGNKNNSDEMDKKEKTKFIHKFSPSNSSENNKPHDFLNKIVKTKIQMKFKNNKLKNMHMEIQNKLQEQVTQLKHIFPGIKTIDFIFEKQKNHDQSIENISKKSFYEENFIHQNIFNNSNLKLSQENHVKILDLLKETIYGINKNIEKDINLNKEQKFIKQFSLQMPISDEHFHSLKFHFKLKFCCFIFSKFFDLKKVEKMYQLIYTFINFFEFLMKDSNTELISENYFYEDTIISSIFNLSISTKLEKMRIYYFIKKILIYVNCHLDTFNQFIDYKLGNTKDLSEHFSLLFIKQKKQKSRITINKNLKEMNLETLVANLSISKIQLFIFFSKINFDDFTKPQVIKFKTSPDSPQHTITLNVFERDKIICGKNRRKDEKIKFAFKGIRNRLFQNFCQKDKIKTPAKILKKKFNKKYLLNNEEAIKYFYNNELSKTDLYHLKDLHTLQKNMLKYKNSNYVGDMLEISIFSKPNDLLMQDFSSFSNFEKLLFHPQSKVSWFLQDILSTVPAFEKFFVFPANKVIKRIKK